MIDIHAHCLPVISRAEAAAIGAGRAPWLAMAPGGERGLGASLSGGEQQMLAIGRALLTNPRLLFLDEATKGPAPLIRNEIWSGLTRLRDTGLSMIVIDQHIGPMLRLADRHYILEQGRVVWQGDSDTLRDQPTVLHQYLGV